MNPETKQCQNCKTDFVLDAEDAEFYNKMDVPTPTFCSECRLQRRLAYFSLTKLYKRDCDLCKKGFVSMYHPDAPYTVYCPTCWYSDDWDVYDYGRDYDFSRPFFEQFQELWREVPALGLLLNPNKNVNSDYNNYVTNLKNSYLNFQAQNSEQCAYNMYCINNTEVVDSANIGQCELCFDLFHGFKSNNCIGCYNALESMNCYFTRDCSNCQNCFGCANLVNAKYCWFNEQLDEKTYKERLVEVDLGSYAQYQKSKQDAKDFWKTQPPKPLHFEMAPGCTGNYIFESSNCRDSFDSSSCKDCRYMFMCTGTPISDSYDVSAWGNNMNQIYESCTVGEQSSNVAFCNTAAVSRNVWYSETIINCNDVLGCSSIRNGSYVIFNKRYEKEEYEVLRGKIIKHMHDMPYIDKQGHEYKPGEFFPPELSPFEYKSTIAQNFFPVSEEGRTARGYTNYSDKENTYSITMQASDLPDNITEVDDSILKETIACEKTGKAFRIQPIELQFLQRMSLPLPRIAPMERIDERINGWTKERVLIERESSLSGEKFMTPYTKEDAPYILSPEEYKREFLG